MTFVYQGADTQVVYFRPSGEYPTTSGAAIWVGLVQESTTDENEKREPIRYMVGPGTRNLDMFLDKNPEYTGTLRFYVQDGKFFTWAMGSVYETAGSTHTIVESGGNMYWISIEDLKGSTVANRTIKRTFNGATIETLTLRGKEGEPIEAEAEWVAQSVTYASGTGTSINSDSTVPYMWDDVTIRISGGGINGDLSEAKDFEWSITNNFDNPYYLANTRYKGQSIPGNREYAVTITLNLTEATGGMIYDQLYRGGSAFNGQINLMRTSGTDDLRIIFSGAKITGFEQNTPAEGTIEAKLDFIPQTCTIIVRDSTTAYPFLL
jgi:hypothetical protein